jgi:hypothetical protein
VKEANDATPFVMGGRLLLVYACFSNPFPTILIPWRFVPHAKDSISVICNLGNKSIVSASRVDL